MKLNHSPNPLLLSGIAVVLAGVCMGVAGKITPIYDGLGQPDEPYRYVVPPASKPPTPTPAVARGTFAATQVRGSSVDGIYVAGSETGPQFALTLSPHAVNVSVRATKVEVTATPLAPDRQPSDGTIAGNVYRLIISSDVGRPVIVKTKDRAIYRYIDLRLPQGFPPGATMEHQIGSGAWQQLTTTRVGVDIYEAPINEVGDYALVKLKGSPKTSQSATTGKLAIIGGLVALVAGMAAVILTIRSGVHKKRR